MREHSCNYSSGGFTAFPRGENSPPMDKRARARRKRIFAIAHRELSQANFANWVTRAVAADQVAYTEGKLNAQKQIGWPEAIYEPLALINTGIYLF